MSFDLVFFGERLPTSFLVTLDAVVSVSFLAIVALFYRWYGKHWREPDELSKMIIGSLFSIGGTLCLVVAASAAGAAHRAHPPGSGQRVEGRVRLTGTAVVGGLGAGRQQRHPTGLLQCPSERHSDTSA